MYWFSDEWEIRSPSQLSRDASTTGDRMRIAGYSVLGGLRPIDRRQDWQMGLFGILKRAFHAGAAWFRQGGASPAVSEETATPVVKLVNVILVDSIKRGASHIEVEPRQDVSAVTFRINNVPYYVMALPVHLHEPVVRRIKLMADILLADPRVPHDGSFRIKAVFDNRPCDFRFVVSTTPTALGDTVLLQRTGSNWAFSGKQRLACEGQHGLNAARSLGVRARALGKRILRFRETLRGRPTSGSS
jgi:Type II/IV secretion system protein